MEQRSLRLGDIVDDYCPRERRLTNHVVVALVGETIKQTRCSTCDAEHVYKGARVPSRKKKTDGPEVETAVLASVNGTQLVARIERTDRSDPTEEAARRTGPPGSDPHTPATAASSATAASDGSDSNHDSDQPGGDQLPGGWVGHRTLIRATLPRTENDPPPPRPIPEFTMHQRQPRGGQGFRGGQGWGDRGRGGPRGNFSFGSGSSGNGHPGADRNGNVNGNSGGGGFGSNHSHRPGGGPQSPGNDQGRPPGQGGKRHRHGKHRRPR